jgi:IS30 family transposase
MEMANHKWLTDKTGIDIYFAHPYSPGNMEPTKTQMDLSQTLFPKG